MKSRRKWIGLLAMVVLLAPSLTQAQQGSPTPPPGPEIAYGPGGPGMGPDDAIAFVGFEGGVGGKTVTGAPFSATFSTQTTQTLADGNKIQRSTTGTFARDSQGRTRHDMTLPGSVSWAASGRTAPHVIFDQRRRSRLRNTFSNPTLRLRARCVRRTACTTTVVRVPSGRRIHRRADRERTQKRCGDDVARHADDQRRASRGYALHANDSGGRHRQPESDRHHDREMVFVRPANGGPEQTQRPAHRRDDHAVDEHSAHRAGCEPFRRCRPITR